LEEFLKPNEITQHKLAVDIGVPPCRINEIVHDVRSISADTALRLGRYFSSSPQFWLNLQSLEKIEHKMGKDLERIKTLKRAA